jgi:hypothetical protein
MKNILKDYTQDEGGNWLYTPQDTILKADVKRKDGTLKAKYKDLPRYKLIPIYEDYFVKEFNKTLSDLNKDVFKFLKDNIL